MGGNVFKNKTQSIKKENIMPTVELYFQELSKVFPGKKNIFTLENMKFIGSVLKKDISGDIDFAIDINSIIDKDFSDKSIQKWGLNPEEVKTQMLTYKKRARTATDSELMVRAILKGIVTKINNDAINLYCDEKKITAGNIFGLFPQYNGDKEKLDYGVQIDWMVGNLDWLEFSYYSESYEGNVKGLHRTQLLLSMFNAVGLSFNHTKGVSNLKTKEVLANTPQQAIKILEEKYAIELGESFNNYFKLIEIIQTLPKNDIYDIYDIYLKILDRTRCDIPDGLQKYWLENKEKLNLSGKFLPETSLLYEKI